jgi:hypothetical protein
MTAEEILHATAVHFETKFQDFEQRVRQKIFQDAKYSYSNTIRLGETSTQWIVELLGSASFNRKYKFKITPPTSTERVDTVDDFVNIGYRNKKREYPPIIDIGGHDNAIESLTLATPYDKKMFEQKLNFNLNRSQLNTTYDTDTLLKISPSADRFILKDIDLIQSNGILLFFKRITAILIVQKRTGLQDYSKWLEMEWVKRRLTLKPDLGIIVGQGTNIDKFALDLSGLSSQNISENVIDSFIRNHKDYFCKALGHIDAVPQLRLPLVNKKGFDNKDQYLQPDYLLKRTDGYYDILDLKTSLLKEKSLVKGKKKRIMFKDYVDELISQLVGYKRYFNDPAHVKLAKERGIEVYDPKLYGIIGNHNNFIVDDVQLAMEPYKDNIILLGYNSVVDLLKAGGLSGRATPV